MASPLVRSGSDSTDAIYFGAGFPPVPSGLVKKIQLGEFIDMAELTIDRLSKPVQAKVLPVVSIVEWIQCFTNYISIRDRAQPEKVPDLLSYECFMLEAHLEYAADGWAVYDQKFCQIATSCQTMRWTQRDTDLWNMVFKSHQRRPHCKRTLFWLLSPIRSMQWSASVYPKRGSQQPSNPLSHASAGSGAINDAAFQTVPTFMPV